MLWKTVSQRITEWGSELLSGDAVREVSEGIGEEDSTEEAHSVVGPSLRGAAWNAITSFFLPKKTEHESNQQGSSHNSDER